jgi:hypothetical protein
MIRAFIDKKDQKRAYQNLSNWLYGVDRPLGSELLQDGLEAARVSITASKLGYCLINTCILEAARITFKSILEESLIIDCSYFILFLWFK